MSSALAVVPRLQPAGAVSLAPFPAEALGDLWAWMQEYPRANFDDYGPKDLELFRIMWLTRVHMGCKLIGVSLDTKLVGAIGFMPGAVGRFCGICFSKEVHGQGVAQQAVTALLMALFAEGYGKVTAEYMVTNRRVHKFLARLGAEQEGYFRGETMQNGKLADVRRVAFRRPVEN